MTTRLRQVLGGLMLMLGPAGAGAQTKVLRIDMGAVNPEKGYHLAWSAAAGLQVTPQSTLLLEFSRQNLSEEIGGPMSVWESYLGGAWEYGFGFPRTMQRQLFFIGHGGLLIRPNPLANAPYAGVGLGLRYPVSEWIGFHARVEEMLDFPKSQVVTGCDEFGDCGPFKVGGSLEHNLSVFVGVEVKR
ncbi:MAG TPA: hypothetical protein VEV39_00295 [Gemmatimonadales bacterium]|nr:hypothetical protein [Gemmatimonadales bacterium]